MIPQKTKKIPKNRDDDLGKEDPASIEEDFF
jgi:hypothetical protein